MTKLLLTLEELRVVQLRAEPGEVHRGHRERLRLGGLTATTARIQ